MGEVYSSPMPPGIPPAGALGAFAVMTSSMRRINAALSDADLIGLLFNHDWFNDAVCDAVL